MLKTPVFLRGPHAVYTMPFALRAVFRHPGFYAAKCRSLRRWRFEQAATRCTLPESTRTKENTMLEPIVEVLIVLTIALVVGTALGWGGIWLLDRLCKHESRD